MNIVHVCKVWYPRVTGVTVHVENLAKLMAGAGHRVTVVTYEHFGGPSTAADKGLMESGVRVVRIRPGAGRRIIRAIVSESPEIVHAHGIWEHVWPAFIAAKRSGARFVMTAHGTWQFLYGTPGFELEKRRLKYRLYYHTLWRFMGYRSHAMIALNAIEQKAHQGLGARRVERIPNGVSCREFSPGARREGPAGTDGPYILFAGSVQAQKGIFTLIDAIQILSRRGEVPQVLVAGQGPDLDRAKEAAVGLDIRFLGRVDRRRLPGLMAQALLFVLPSNYESFATVFLEAMASGTPCIGTATGGTPEIIDDRVNGFLIPPEDGPALADAIQDALFDTEGLGIKGSRARQKIMQYYDWPVLAKRLLAVYGPCGSRPEPGYDK